MPLDDALRQLREREAELARVQRIGQIGGLEVDLRGGHFRNKRSPEYLAVHGLPPEAANETHENWVARIHPQDRERVVSHFQRSVLSRDVDYEVEYRIIRPSDKEVRWILAKAEIERDADGNPIRLVGAHIDITARRSAEEQRELIARELRHRIANVFTVIGSLISMSAREAPAAGSFAQRLNGRIEALHRAHNLVVEKSLETDSDALRDLLGRLLAPYDESDRQRIEISGEDVKIGQKAATALALIIHELSTNAVKYGALSTAVGRIRLGVSSDPEITRLQWVETGGPKITAPPSREGFGSTLVNRAARAQLAAEMTFAWEESGLSVLINIPTGRLIS